MSRKINKYLTHVGKYHLGIFGYFITLVDDIYRGSLIYTKNTEIILQYNILLF